jgi:phosphoserine phosphatase
VRATFIVEKVYSDSRSDLPLYELANQKFYVRKGVLTQGIA